MKPLPLSYRVPLEGTVLIEASAGTGKTYTLERLIARHILWHGRTIDEVLAVTFTNAAATDIKLRLHRFLKRCFDHDLLEADEDIEFLFSECPAEVSEALLRRRLSDALADFDRASVFTIHGFCQRLMQDYAIELAQPIPLPALLEDETALRLQVCEEFWRHCGQNPEFADCLDVALGSPSDLVKQLAELLSTAVLKPDKPVLLKPSLQAAFERLLACYQSQKQPAFDALELALTQDALHKTDFKSITDIERRFAELDAFMMQPDFSVLPRFIKLSFSEIREKKNKTKPDNPLFHQLDEWHSVVDEFEDYQRNCRIYLFHELRVFARKRLAVLKSERNVIGFDDIIETVHQSLESDTNGSLAQKIRNAYPVALVDEFQDTDERQWRIFELIYRSGSPASLTLIGDPKQAIYGFRGGDIHTYLKVQALAGHRETLAYNFRSNQALLDGIESVFLARHTHPFPEPGIPFVKVTAGHSGESLHRVDGEIPALSFFGSDCQNQSGITEARISCARQCADAISDLLNQAQSGKISVKHTDADRSLAAGDIAVLVSKHQEAELIVKQLQRRGVAAVCVRRESLFDCYEALDILQILHAIEHSSSHMALTSAENGRLLRAAMEDGGYCLDWALMAQRLEEVGPLGALADLLHSAAKRLLSSTDGERQMTNYSQVLEQLQIGFCPSIGPGHYLHWLGRQITLANEAKADGLVRPKLDSSKTRVRVMTLHQSKGLEFGLVFMPFTAIRSSHKSAFARFYDGQQRCLHLDPAHADAETTTRIDAEQASENLRLLYVGMTRAKFGLRCGWGWVKDLEMSSLGYLLLPKTPVDGQSCSDAVSHFSHSHETNYTELHNNTEASRAQLKVAAFKTLPISWQISSFSSLHRSQDTPSFRPADDEVSAVSTGLKSPFKGADFGNALHRVLEHYQPVDWPEGMPGTIAMSQCQYALIHYGYSPELAMQGASLIATLASNTLLAQLPEGVRLLDLPMADQRQELEFHLKLNHVDGLKVLDLLHLHGYCIGRDRFGFTQRLNGLLNGKIDLLYRHRDKLHILDYKSNSLSDYDPDSLKQSIADHEYDLQYLLYTVAVHRWLRFSRPEYAYARHFGGIRYLYVRGLDVMQPGHGVFSDMPDESLINALDRCFCEEVDAHG
jgi:exodeoxyribonuclease V beta subunit